MLIVVVLDDCAAARMNCTRCVSSVSFFVCVGGDLVCMRVCVKLQM